MITRLVRAILDTLGEYRIAKRAGTQDPSFTFYWIEKMPKPGVPIAKKT
jgi:hypothetical protein